MRSLNEVKNEETFWRTIAIFLKVFNTSISSLDFEGKMDMAIVHIDIWSRWTNRYASMETGKVSNGSEYRDVKTWTKFRVKKILLPVYLPTNQNFPYLIC